MTAVIIAIFFVLIHLLYYTQEFPKTLIFQRYNKESRKTAIFAMSEDRMKKTTVVSIAVIAGLALLLGALIVRGTIIVPNFDFTTISYQTANVLAAKPEKPQESKSFRLFDGLTTPSQTNVLARDFVDLYLQARDQNPDQKISENEQEAIGKSLANVAREKYTRLANPYIYEDLRIQETETIERLTIYLDNYGRIFGSSFPESESSSDGPQELLIFFSSVGDEDFAQLETLTPYIERYQKAAEEFASLRVPERFADFHLETINTFANVSLALSHMKAYEHDPVGALFGADQFTQEVTNFILSLGELRDVLENLTLPFVEGSDGDLFERYLQTI